jgi:preprotein translocase subunit SecA
VIEPSIYASEKDRAGIAEFNSSGLWPGESTPRPWPKKSRTVVSRPKVGRNDPCPCGSGRKFKKCCA